jgi:hypothetical protein
MAESVKRQAVIAFMVLLLLLGIITSFLIWVTPVVKIVPIDKAMQSVEAERRSKELEARLLKSSDEAPPQQHPNP